MTEHRIVKTASFPAWAVLTDFCLVGINHLIKKHFRVWLNVNVIGYTSVLLQVGVECGKLRDHLKGAILQMCYT